MFNISICIFPIILMGFGSIFAVSVFLLSDGFHLVYLPKFPNT